jgi:hypothetical protein
MRTLILSLLSAGLMLTSAPASAAEPQAPAAGKPAIRFGLGLSTAFGPTPINNALVARLELSQKFVVNGGLGLRFQSGDFDEGTNFGVGASAEYRAFQRENVNFHILGGVSFCSFSVSTDPVERTAGNGDTLRETTTDTTADIGLFAGAGAEYFFPNTNNQFSLEVNVGPGIHLLSRRREEKVINVTRNQTTTTTADDNAVALALGESLSSGVLFTYYF